MPDVLLGEAEFRRRFLSQFANPAFEPLRADLDRIAGAAWHAYRHHRKAPRKRKAGTEFSDSDYDLAVDWIAAHEAVEKAQSEYEDPTQPPCILPVVVTRRAPAARYRTPRRA